MQKHIKTIKINNQKIDFTKQNMWLIAACDNVEIDRIELYRIDIDEAIKHLSLLINNKTFENTKYSNKNLCNTIKELNYTEESYRITKPSINWYHLYINDKLITSNDIFGIIDRLYQIARQCGIQRDLL